MLRRISYVFLCAVPFLNFAVVGMRAFRVPGVYQVAGIVYFGAIAIAAWILGGRTMIYGAEQEQRISFAGLLLLVPSTLMALLWVGLGPPWEATPVENRMRYLVLLTDTVAVTAGFVVLGQALREASERLYSTLASTFAILAGGAYVVWNCFMLGLYVMKARGEQTPAAFRSLSEPIDMLLFTACVLTYLATLLLAICLGRVGLLGRGASRAYLIANTVFLALILTRGLAFPDPTASSTPWYLNLAFIAGIPAVPWIMPYLLGVVLLRKAGSKTVGTELT